jgi:hypothetical protein
MLEPSWPGYRDDYLVHESGTASVLAFAAISQQVDINK